MPSSKTNTTITGFLLLAWTAAMLAAAPATAQVRGEIIGAGMSRMPIAVPDLKRLAPGDAAAAEEFVRVLSHDLELSGLFRVIKPSAYIDDPQRSGTELADINFDNWLSIGARGLIRGAYSSEPGGFRVESRFFDVPGRANLGGLRVTGVDGAVAQAAHRMADAVIEFVTGRRGPFDSRIAFVSNRGGFAREVMIYSFEGKVEPLTKHRSITMEPAWDAAGKNVLFTSFRDGRPALFSIELATNKETRLASKMGLNVGGAWSPDGKLLAVSREEAGNTDIYLINFDAGTQSKLTDHWGIDVDPSWSPDGKQLAFCSSRSGTPQVYTTAVSGGRATRISFEGSYNCAPTWSPDGRYLAYAGRVSGRFQIFVVEAAGGEPRQLTFMGSNEDPSWSPDSRFIAFSGQRGGRKKLFMVDLSGRWEQQLTDGSGDDSSPSWSRRLE